ncbi:SPRY domain-containing SOCS box protein 3-like [Planococcus citri]|uniref:SPRY domain-containing SOCS box protein 3-like n=1 Tax=Planococcus citri TaxID=170843 RepID=UPI0031F89B1D
MFEDDQNKINEIQDNVSNTNLNNPLIDTDTWTWNPNCKSCDVRIIDKNQKCVLFHPSWSQGTSAIRGTKMLNNTRSYWEIFIPKGICGTSMMFGIGTERSRLGSPDYINLIGEDERSWGLSHKGFLCHDGEYKKFCRPFREHLPTTVGLLFDGIYGTLSYFKDDICLGVGFRDLNKIKEPLYPMISSTSAKTIMTLKSTGSEFVSLKDRCRAVILENLKCIDDVQKLPLPSKMREYITYGKCRTG